MLIVMGLLDANDSIEFMRIFESPGEDGPPSRPVLVVTFLAVLELARLAVLRLYQGLSEGGTPEGPIRVRRTLLKSDDSDWREKIADSM